MCITSCKSVLTYGHLPGLPSPKSIPSIEIILVDVKHLICVFYTHANLRKELAELFAVPLSDRGFGGGAC
jgi:hypothetical protein